MRVEVMMMGTQTHNAYYDSLYHTCTLHGQLLFVRIFLSHISLPFSLNGIHSFIHSYTQGVPVLCSLLHLAIVLASLGEQDATAPLAEFNNVFDPAGDPQQAFIGMVSKYPNFVAEEWSHVLTCTYECKTKKAKKKANTVILCVCVCRDVNGRNHVVRDYQAHDDKMKAHICSLLASKRFPNLILLSFVVHIERIIIIIIIIKTFSILQFRFSSHQGIYSSVAGSGWMHWKRALRRPFPLALACCFATSLDHRAFYYTGWRQKNLDAPWTTTRRRKMPNGKKKSKNEERLVDVFFSLDSPRYYST
jgi:hypothetical protein